MCPPRFSRLNTDKIRSAKQNNILGVCMADRKITKVKYGNTERMSFAQIHEVIDMPDLVEVQKTSYNDFIDNGIK